MDLNEMPPIIGEAAEERVSAKWRWWVHFTILALLPVAVGIAGAFHRDRTAPMLPSTVGGLLKVSAYELLVPGLFFLLAGLFSRPTTEQLMLKWRGGVKPVLFGLGYSAVLRVGIMIFVLIVAGLVALVLRSRNLESLRPQTENLVNAAALAQNPVYLVLCVTLISFVVAGLREELWRAGMFAGLGALFPNQFATRSGKAAAVVLVGVLFGAAHTTQGPAGVIFAGLLGIGLGAIMLVHRSIWEAVWAHGFFDALTFAALYFVARYFPEVLRNI